MPLIDKTNYLCVGCGGCAYKCPKQSISMEINLMGQFIPQVDYNSCIECKLCEKNCPVYHGVEIPKQIYHNGIVGNYLSCYMGYDVSLERTSASGGFVTGALKHLLNTGTIDYAVCLRNIKKNNSYYQYQFIDNPDNLISCSKSAYYPVELSGMLRHIKIHKGRYAIVVLPCQAKIIRNLQKTDSILRERIVFLLGLVCGGMPGSALVEYVDRSLNINPNEVSQISFRDKNEETQSNDYGITIKTDNDKIYKSHIQKETFGFAFLNKLFNYKACNVCDDIYAEYADAVFMDAWLPEYKDDKIGRSICLIRNDRLHHAMKDYFESNPNCEEVSVEIPIKAQNTVGLVLRKKKQAYFKRVIYKKLGYLSPDAGNHKFTISERIKFLIRTIQEFLIQRKSNIMWLNFKEGKTSFLKFDSSVHKYVKTLKKI